MRFSWSIRARTSGRSSSSCLTAVPMVLRLDAMKSVSRVTSVMLVARALRSSDSTGDSCTTWLKFARMFRSSASISSASDSAGRRSPRATSARRYGRVAITRSSRIRARPWTISRRLPSGSLNILWMWVSVPTSWRSPWPGSSCDGSFCVKTPITLAPAMASSMSLTERLARDGQRHERVRKQHGVAQRQHRHVARHGVRALTGARLDVRVVSSLMSPPLLQATLAPVVDGRGSGLAESLALYLLDAEREATM